MIHYPYLCTNQNKKHTFMNRIKKLLIRINQSRVLKYAVVIVLGITLVGFVGDNSVWSHFRNKQKIAELQSEIKMHQERYEHDQAQLRQLDRDPKAIEKIARERYFMKTDNEDIFVLSDDEHATKTTTTDETTE